MIDGAAGPMTMLASPEVRALNVDLGAGSVELDRGRQYLAAGQYDDTALPGSA